MTTLLVIIYIAFISLGLPDALLGSGWVSINNDFAVPSASAGIISIIVACGTVISSFNCQRLLAKFGTGKVTFFSVLLTALALLGNSLANNFVWLIVFAVPMGLGAGAVDSALNNFVALHYKAKHMNWLHCFWGIGATCGPMVMAFFITTSFGWRGGYFSIFVLQIALVVVLLVTLPLWKKSEKSAQPLVENTPSEETLPSQERTSAIIPLRQILKMRGVIPAFIAFFCYCSAESLLGLWGGSFLAIYRGVDASTSALWVSFYYLGITFGRFLSGFLSIKVSSRNMIYIGSALSLVGIIALALPLPTVVSAVSFVLIGVGFAPIYPAMLHATPERFGENNSSALMGVQMASAYIGVIVVPSVSGYIFQLASLMLLPYFLLSLGLIMLLTTIIVERLTKKVPKLAQKDV